MSQESKTATRRAIGFALTAVATATTLSLLFVLIRGAWSVAANHYLQLGMFNSILFQVVSPLGDCIRDGLTLAALAVLALLAFSVGTRAIGAPSLGPGGTGPWRPRVMLAAYTTIAAAIFYLYLKNVYPEFKGLTRSMLPHQPWRDVSLGLAFVALFLLTLASSCVMKLGDTRFLRDRVGRPSVSKVCIALFTAVPLLLAPVLSGAYARHLVGERPNVILIVVDTLRADHLGAYGSRDGLTPVLDGLAEESLVYRNTLAQGPNTINSSASLLTSLYPSEHGYFDFRARVSSTAVTLAELLREHGYATFAVSTNPHVSSRNGLGQGFGTFVQDVSWKNTDAAEVNRIFLDWLDESPPRPFFGMLWYIDPHVPYGPPGPLLHQSVPVGLRSQITPDTQKPDSPALSEKARYVAKLLYQGEVRYLDTQLGLLFDELRAKNVLENSVLVMTADHGEAFWEYEDVHGRPLVGHGHSLRSQEILVPLLIRFPDSSERGVIEPRVDLIDVAPSILDAVEIPRTARISQLLRGTSLPGIPLGREATPRREYSVSELITQEYGAYVIRSIQDDRNKLVLTYRYGETEFDPPLEEYYELRDGEEVRVPVESAGAVPKLRQALSSWERTLEPLGSNQVVLISDDEERLRERLAVLGYLEAGG